MPRNGTPVVVDAAAPCGSTSPDSASESSVARAAPTPGRTMRSTAVEVGRGADEPVLEAEPFERVAHARGVARPVVDDRDHRAKLPTGRFVPRGVQ